MLNAVAGVWPVDDGRIILDGEDITALPDYKRAKYIGRVFQDPMMGTAPNMQRGESRPSQCAAASAAGLAGRDQSGARGVPRESARPRPRP